MLGLYLPPVFTMNMLPNPPQTIISLPVHTAVCRARASGALVVLVGVQLSVLGLYLAPLFKLPAVIGSAPDDHFSAGPHRRVIASGNGRIVVLTAVQLSAVGLYLAPLFNLPPLLSVPPQMIISVPVHTAV